MESSSTCVTGKLAGTETRMNHCLADRYWITKRPFYRYGGHIELTGFKEYYGMPRGHEETIQYTCISIYARFSGQFFFKFS